MNNKFKFSGEALEALESILTALEIDEPKVHAQSQLETIGLKTILNLIGKLDKEEQEAMATLAKLKDRNFILKFYEFFNDAEIQEAFILEFKDFINYFFSKSGGNFSQEQLEEVDSILEKYYSSLK